MPIERLSERISHLGVTAGLGLAYRLRYTIP